MTQKAKVRSTLAQEETNAGDTDQSVDEQDEQGIERSQKAEGTDGCHDEAEDEADDQAKYAEGGDRADGRLSRWV